MEKITVKTSQRAYDVLVEEGFFVDGGIPGQVRPFAKPGERVVCISDRIVWELYGARFREQFPEAAPVLIEPGEASKNLAVLGGVFDRFAEEHLSRGGLVIAFGGGVVGDLAGFAAACWMRGVPVVQIPTTLLAMIDSSVGGKTAVDIPAGKNLVGAFHQPSLVLIDPAFLATLPEREFASGMAEMLKTGAIKSAPLFNALAETPQGVHAATEARIADCIRIKRDVVEADEFEGGLRKLLNFGHTFGHAIEVKYGYSKYTHGEAVACGLRIACALGERLGVTEPGTAARMDQALSRYGLLFEESAADLLSFIRGDKKAVLHSVDVILLRRIGEAFVHPMEFDELEARLSEFACDE
ncbi:MAG: 3-dehydroquinate synthase [Clostridiales bacterium]|nr:3-dehydroquinate synthase [Clostridiales bacterium]